MTDQEYTERLQRVLSAQYSAGDVVGLRDATQRAFGAFPSDVHKVLTSLGVKVTIQPDEGRRDSDIGSRSPAPHPADFDWRFTPATRIWLAGEIASTAQQEHAHILLLGAPSLLPPLAAQGFDVTLVDQNPLITAALSSPDNVRIITADFLAPFESRDVAVVVADPPWYLEHYRACIDRGAELCSDLGFFFLSVLPWLTRPAAIDDRREIVRYAEENGFDIWHVFPEVLLYDSPPFEQAALAQHGLTCSAWRVADLFVFRKFEGKCKPPTVHQAQPVVERWDSYLLPHQLHVKVRSDRRQQVRPFSFAVLNDRGTLDTVSRRYPNRGEIDVWTSDNRAFEVSDRRIATSVIAGLAAGESLFEAIARVTNEYALTSEEQKNVWAVMQGLGIHMPTEQPQTPPEERRVAEDSHPTGNPVREA